MPFKGLKPTAIRAFLHYFGGLLAIVGVVFVLLRFYSYSAELESFNLSHATLAIVLVSSLAYFMANFLLGFAWRNILNNNGCAISVCSAQKVYGVSQLSKYVPGNIFQFAGRQAMGMAAGIPAWELAKSSVWELALLSLAAALFGFIALSLVVGGYTTSLGLLLFFVSVAVVFAIIYFWVSRSLAFSLVLYLSFLLVSGCLFVLVLSSIGMFETDRKLPSWPIICAAYVLGWLAGLVTPGAPAGVGVRELVLLFLLDGAVSEADLLVAVILGRVVTVSGDILYFLAALLMRESKS